MRAARDAARRAHGCTRESRNIRNRLDRFRARGGERAPDTGQAEFRKRRHEFVDGSAGPARKRSHDPQIHAEIGAVLRERRHTRGGMSFASGLVAMQITRRRILDVMTAVAGVALLVVALLVFDSRTRYVSGADFASVSEDMNYLAVAVTLLVAQVVRGEVVDHASMFVFTTAAVVLVVLLMRL
jgi:hypothetical protein